MDADAFARPISSPRRDVRLNPARRRRAVQLLHVGPYDKIGESGRAHAGIRGR